MLSRELRYTVDPVAMARAVGVEPDEWQASLLYDMPNRTMILAPRQSGKSTVTALAAMWFSLAKSPANIIIVSPTSAQSQLMLSTLGRFLAKLPGGPSFDSESEKRIQLSNSSVIRALHGDERTLRGHASVSFLALDEAGSIKDSLIAGVAPMLVVKSGTWFVVGTPRGQVGWFADNWAARDNTWTRIRVDASQCPRLTKAELDKQLATLGPITFRQEFGLEWLADNEAAFDPAAIANCFSNPEVKPLWV
jgi:hypothetical protein